MGKSSSKCNHDLSLSKFGLFWASEEKDIKPAGFRESFREDITHLTPGPLPPPVTQLFRGCPIAESAPLVFKGMEAGGQQWTSCFFELCPMVAHSTHTHTHTHTRHSQFSHTEPFDTDIHHSLTTRTLSHKRQTDVQPARNYACFFHFLAHLYHQWALRVVGTAPTPQALQFGSRWFSHLLIISGPPKKYHHTVETTQKTCSLVLAALRLRAALQHSRKAARSGPWLPALASH